MKKYELDLAEDNIKYTIENDILKRNAKLINLMRLLNNVDESFIISIDGAWGSGKTFFLKQLFYIARNHEKVNAFTQQQKSIIESFSNKHLVVYYNAWENDDHETPVESLVYNILNEYPNKKNNIENPQELFNSTKEILINVIDKLSFGVISKDCFENLQSFQELADNINTLEEKKIALKKLFDQLITDDERILLIIDELDRCKPDYAVKMLETVKHFYNNKKITVIVSTNNVQLSNTIKHFYGYGFDGYGYLNKIYDTVINLEIENLKEYIKHYCNILKDTYLPEDMSYLLFKYFNFSYRECNKYMSMYRILEPYTSYTDGFDTNKYSVESNMILPMTIALKIKDINKYNDFANGKGEDVIINFVSFVEKFEKSEGYINWFKDILAVKEGEKLTDKFIERYKSIFDNKNNFRSFPYMDAISMLGNNVNYENSNK